MNPEAASLGLKTISAGLEGKIQMPTFDYCKFSNNGLKRQRELGLYLEHAYIRDRLLFLISPASKLPLLPVVTTNSVLCLYPEH